MSRNASHAAANPHVGATGVPQSESKESDPSFQPEDEEPLPVASRGGAGIPPSVSATSRNLNPHVMFRAPPTIPLDGKNYIGWAYQMKSLLASS